MLDVLEHVPEPRAVLAEAHRVLRPGGVLVLSVPHRGLLAPLDALNVYPALRRRFPSWQPLEPADETGPGGHRHFTIEELGELLGNRFVIDRTARTGLGLAELVHLGLLVTFKGLLRLAGRLPGVAAAALPRVPRRRPHSGRSARLSPDGQGDRRAGGKRE